MYPPGGVYQLHYDVMVSRLSYLAANKWLDLVITRHNEGNT